MVPGSEAQNDCLREGMGYTIVYACMSVPEFNVRYLLQLFSLLIFETSLINPKTHL